jgi:hypothetical protein
VPQIGIHIDPDAPYEAGAILLAVVAFASSDDPKLAEAQAALCYAALLAKGADDDWAWTPQRLKPGYLLPASESRRLERTVIAAVNRRLRAARIAGPLMVQAETGSAPVLEGMKRLSIRALAKRDLQEQQAGRGETTNVTAQIWRASLRVIHLAVALAQAIRELEHLGHDNKELWALKILWRPDLIRWTIERAERLEPLAERLPNLKHMPELVRLRLG